MGGGAGGGGRGSCVTCNALSSFEAWRALLLSKVSRWCERPQIIFQLELSVDQCSTGQRQGGCGRG